MVSIIEGFNNNVIKNFQSFGATLVQFQKFDPHFGPAATATKTQRMRKNLTYEDALALKELCPSMLAVSPERYWFGRRRRRRPTSSYEGEAATPDTLVGVTEDYPIANNHFVGEGRFITEGDVRRSARGDRPRLRASPRRSSRARDPIGKVVTIAGRKYTVIGVMEKQGATMFESTDSHVYLPITTFDSHFPWIKRERGVNIATVPKQPEWVDRIIEEGTRSCARGAGAVQQAERLRDHDAGQADRELPARSPAASRWR